jgi:phytoene synthase
VAADDAFHSFAEKWLADNPEQRIVAVFRAPVQQRVAAAFGALVHELENSAFELREPQVAAAKLAWWRRELAQARHGVAQHPITRELLAAAAPQALAGSGIEGLADGALALVDAPAPADLTAQRSALTAFYAPVAALEARLSAMPVSAHNVDLWTSARLVRWLRTPARLADQALALPLDLLARHGVTRAGLDADAPARRAVFADHLAAIAQLLRDALADAHADLGRRVRGRVDLDLVTRVASQSDPAQSLARAHAAPWRTAWIAWREARRAP